MNRNDLVDAVAVSANMTKADAATAVIPRHPKVASEYHDRQCTEAVDGSSRGAAETV